MIHLVLMVALAAADAGAADAGLDFSDPLYAVCPEAPPPVMLDGGSWLSSSSRGARNACLMATCESRRRTLEPIAQGPAPFSSGSLVVDLALWGLGVLAGIVLGWGARGLFGR